MKCPANSGPGYRKYPNHHVATAPAGGRVRITFNGEVIADSRDAIRLEESNHDAVYYLPRSDVMMERLARTTRRTYCPFKGDASYYTVSSGNRTAENAVWTYEQPYDEVSAIGERLAFYPHKVDAITVTPE